MGNPPARVAGFFRPALVDRSRWTGIGWPEAIGLNWWRGSDGRARHVIRPVDPAGLLPAALASLVEPPRIPVQFGRSSRRVGSGDSDRAFRLRVKHDSFLTIVFPNNE